MRQIKNYFVHLRTLEWYYTQCEVIQALYLDESFESSKVVALVRHIGWVDDDCTLFNVGDKIIGNSPNKYDVNVRR